MSTTIDEKVVEMRFDNSNFEKNTKETMSTLDKLKQKLNFSGASKGLENINTSANKVNMSGMSNAIETVRTKFSALEVMGVTALANITNSAVNAGKRIVSALTIDPISDGWGEYEMTLNAVQTTMAGTGKTAEEVEKELKKLDEYADKTVYSTADMLNNLPKFTNAGVDLEKATEAMIGIANATALAGGDAGKASIAFYNLGQAIGTGYLTRMDYNSINNAGIATMEWKEQMVEAAIAAGTLTKVGENQYKAGKKTMTLQQLFIDGLQEQWATTDVMMKVFGDYGNETTEIGKKSYAAAQDIKTFSMMMDSLKATAGTGWKDTWQIIFGGLDEAKEFWTGLTNFISDIITGMADFRNNLLEGAFGKTFEGLGKSLSAFTKPVEKVATSLKDLDGIAKEVIGGKWGYGQKRVDALTKAGHNYYEVQNKVNEMLGSSVKYSDKLANSQGTLTDAQKEGLQAQMQLAGSESDRLQALVKLSDAELEAAGFTKEQVEALSDLRTCSEKTGLSVKELVENIDEIDGRWLVINSFKNIGQGLVTVFNAIRDAWKEIFPPMTSEQLFDIIQAFHKFTTKLRVSEETANKIKSTFKGLFAVLDIGLTIIKEVVGGAISLISNFTGVTSGILGATASLGDWASKLRDSIKETNVFGKAVDVVVSFLQKVIDKVKEFIGPGSLFKGFFNILTGIWELITKVGISIGKFFGKSIREGDLVSIVEAFNTILFSGILLGINNFVNNLGEPLENLGDILQSFQTSIQAKTLMRIAIAIGILAVALLLLSSIKPENLGAGITAMSVLFAELLAAMKIFGKIAPNVKNVLRMSTGLISLSFALLILSAALKIMSTMSWDEMGVALLSMATAMGALIGVMWALPKDNKGKINGVVKLAFSLVILASALKILATMSWDDIRRSMAVMAGSLGLFIGLAWALHKTNFKDNTKGMTSLAFSLVILGGALKILATMSWDDIGRSLAVMTGALAIFIGFAWALHATSFKDDTKGMIKMALSLVILGGALKILASMSWDDIGRSLAVMAGALALLIGLTWALHAANSGKVALSMLGLATSLIILGGAMKIFASMDWGDIGRSLVAIGGAFIVLGVAGLLLGPIVPALLGLAGAFALVGVGTLALGVGLGLVAAGISALALAVSAGATAIVAGLSAIILGIIGLVPEIIKIIGDSILLLCAVLIEAAPAIAETILVIVAKVFEALATYAPSIVTSLIKFLVGVLQSLRDELPTLIVAAVEVIGAFFEGIIAALKGIDSTSLLQGVLGLTLLTGLMYLLSGVAALVPGAMVGVLGLGLVITELALVLAAIGALAQIPGLSWLIEQGGNFLQAIGTAIGQFIGGIIGGIALGATSTLPQVGTNLSQFMTNLQPFIDGVKAIDGGILLNIAALSGAILLLTASNLIAGIASFLTFGSSLADLGTQLSMFLINATPFINGAKLIDPSMLDGVKALAETVLILTAANILEGLTSWFAGGSSLAEFGSQLGDLGTNLNEFATNLGTFDESKVTTVNCACQAIKSLAEAANMIPNEGGLWASIVGENSLATFGSYLKDLGTNLSEFVGELGVFTPDQVTTVDCAGQAIKALASAAKEIPNDGGLWGAICGENSLATFGSYLAGLGTSLSDFVANLGTFSPDQVSVVDCAAQAIKALASAAKDIPNDGGLWGAIVGNNSLATFGSYLPGLGTNLSEFVANLGTFDSAQIATVDCAAQAIKALADAADSIPNEGGLWGAIVGDNSLATFAGHLPGLGTNLKNFVGNLGEFTTAQISTVNAACNAIRSISSLGNIDIKDTGSKLKTFGDNMVKFAEKVKSFVGHIGEAGADSITSAVSKIKNLIVMAQSVATINSESLKTFGNSLKDFAKDAVNGFVNVFTDNDPKNKVKNAIKAMVDSGIKGAEDKKSDVEKAFKSVAKTAIDALDSNSVKSSAKTAGKNVVQGFAAGITENTFMAEARARAMALAALQAAKKALAVKSPSREFYKVGDYAGQGFVNALYDSESMSYKAGFTMAEMARNGLSKAISKVADVINSDIDSQPTIRPVLDLSDVESGAGYLNTMFDNGPSVGVMANLRAISSGMNARSQNGVNNEVVSAINKLRKDIGNVRGGDTYNIGDVRYDDENTVASAVKSLVRAVRVEGRV